MSDESTDIGSWFPVPAEHELPEDTQKMFAKVRDNLGLRPERLPVLLLPAGPAADLVRALQVPARTHGQPVDR